MAYTNLPGSYVTLRDGNLSTYVPSDEKSILIVGTATSGLTNEPFLVSDLAGVSREFGATSELADAVAKVKKGGARNIYVMRLPGTAPFVEGIGAGLDVAPGIAGFKITPVQASPEAAAMYGVAYQHATNTSATASAAADIGASIGNLMVVNLETEEIVWKGNAKTGVTLDKGEVDVEFELNDIIGTDVVNPGAEQIKFTVTQADTVTTAGTLRLPLSGTTVVVTLSNGMTRTAMASAVVAAVEAALPFNVTNTTVSGTDPIQFTVTADGTTNADGLLVYGESHPWAGYSARPFFTAAPTVVTSTGITVAVDATQADDADHRIGADLGLYPQDENRPFASAGGGVFVPLKFLISGTTDLESYGLGGTEFDEIGQTVFHAVNFSDATPEAVFNAGATGAVIPRVKRYEKVHTALEDIDLRTFDYLYVVGATFDAPNVVDDGSIGSTNEYPVANTVYDRLGYLAVVDTGNKVYDYFWSDDSTTYQFSSTGSAPSDAVIYKECNFAYLIADRCYEYSADYHFCLGVVGTELPTRQTAAGIRAYFGKAPTYTLDTETGKYFVASSSDNGTGLLGNKFVGGKDSFNDGLKHGGFYATEDRSIDYSESNLILDENSERVDIGKFILVVPIFGTTTNDLNNRALPITINAAPIVAGMLPNLNVTESLIDKTIPGLSVDYRLETSTVDVAIGLGLVCSVKADGVAKIADSPTFAAETSDYTRLTTIQIVAELAKRLRSGTKPFKGKGLSAPRRVALDNTIAETLKEAASGDNQMITKFSFKITQTQKQLVTGKMIVTVGVTPVFELRQIFFSIGLEP